MRQPSGVAGKVGGGGRRKIITKKSKWPSGLMQGPSPLAPQPPWALAGVVLLL